MKVERFWFGFVVSSIALVAVACGPSGAQIKTARGARYRVDAAIVFKETVAAVSENTKVDKADAATGTVATLPRWYEKDGTYVAKALGSEDQVVAQDGAILLGFDIRITGADGVYAVEIIPRAQQVRDGYAAPFPIEPNDPAMPGWVTGKIDALYVAIYEKLKPYEVKG